MCGEASAGRKQNCQQWEDSRAQVHHRIVSVCPDCRIGTFDCGGTVPRCQGEVRQVPAEGSGERCALPRCEGALCEVRHAGSKASLNDALAM
jgi:hypothetical protein